MSEKIAVKPKLFISYSWSNEEHEQWVLELALRLNDSGVHVIIDKWDLREGHDTHHYMERMVNDPTINKVILICDSIYVEKANGRMGGVGTESQIITSEIYNDVSQSKFVAIVLEDDENGKPLVPSYYKSRIYIDLRDELSYDKNYEKLEHWIYDKPLYARPEIGTTPAHLQEEGSIRLTTNTKFLRAMEGLRNARAYAIPALEEYFTAFSKEVERFRGPSPNERADETLITTAEQFKPYRDEAISLISTAASYIEQTSVGNHVHSFFEKLIPFLHRPTTVNLYKEWDIDNYKFIIHELFLHSIAVLIKAEKFISVNNILDRMFYYDHRGHGVSNDTHSFTIFCDEVVSLEVRNRNLQLRRLSLRADMLNGRCSGLDYSFKNIIQADLILYLRSWAMKEQSGIWFPFTLIYLGEYGSSIEVFSRSASASYFNQIKGVIGVSGKEELLELISKLESDHRTRPSSNFGRANLRHITNIDNISTKP